MTHYPEFPDHKFGMFADTSKQAYGQSRPTAKAMRERILLFDKYLREGATSDELALVMGATMEEVARRMPELEKDGKVYKTGRTRDTRKGCKATVWKLVEKNNTPAIRDCASTFNKGVPMKTCDGKN